MLWCFIDELLPGAMYLRDHSAERWQKLLAGTAEAGAGVRAHAETLGTLPKESLDLWKIALSDEHRRLDNVEQKARGVLGAIGVVTPLTTLVLSQSKSSVPLPIAAVTALVYLLLSILLAVRANSISARVYVDPIEYSEALKALSSSIESRAPEIVSAALSLNARDRMAELNRYKINATDASLRAMRNGLLMLVVSSVVALIMQ